MKLTKEQQEQLVSELTDMCCEDTTFLENRIYELVELNGSELYACYIEESEE